MLTFKEKYVMEYVYQKCQGKKSCLISPREIISFAADKYVIFEDELEKIAGSSLRLLGDPSGTAPVPLHGTPITLALGPEGGFTEYEINTLREHSFKSISLGTRILRTEFALAALLGKLLF